MSFHNFSENDHLRTMFIVTMNKMVYNDNDEELCGPQNIILKIDENAYDTVFHIQPPNIPIYPAPYLEKHKDQILDVGRGAAKLWQHLERVHKVITLFK